MRCEKFNWNGDRCTKTGWHFFHRYDHLERIREKNRVVLEERARRRTKEAIGSLPSIIRSPAEREEAAIAEARKRKKIREMREAEELEMRKKRRRDDDEAAAKRRNDDSYGSFIDSTPSSPFDDVNTGSSSSNTSFEGGGGDSGGAGAGGGWDKGD